MMRWTSLPMTNTRSSVWTRSRVLIVDDKWLAMLAMAVQGEFDRVSQTLTTRIRQLAERYDTPLPKLVDEVIDLSARVDEHLKQMGFSR